MDAHDRPQLDFLDGLDFSAVLSNPILDIAARFWEPDRYRAFQVCYRSMRAVDNLVDDRKATGRPITSGERSHYRHMILDWVTSLRRRQRTDSFQQKLLDILERFGVPLWPWERLAEAMVYDLEHNGFKNLATFLRYSEGAAIAPASVFMHLCGIRPASGGYFGPPFDIRKAARPLALFSYLVHIMRDFERDVQRGLIYFADDILARHDLAVSDMKVMASTHVPSASLRNLMTDYLRFAEYYRAKARRVIDQLTPVLSDRYCLSVEIIYNLYHQVFERVDPVSGSFASEELNPRPADVRARIDQTVAAFQESRSKNFPER